MELIKHYQINFMLVLSSICGMLAFFVFVTDTLPVKKRRALLIMELSAMLLLISDRYAYFFRGDTSNLGFYMVRISNFMVFTLTLILCLGFNLYLADLCVTDGNVEKYPKRLKLGNMVILLGIIIIIANLSCGFIYSFDENNFYVRSKTFMLSYVFPLIALLLQLWVVCSYRKKFNKRIFISLLLFSLLPLLASIAQSIYYGISLINMAFGILVIIVYVFALFDMNKKMARANELEIKMLKQEQHDMELLFEQTASALASAIDAKDRYTHGHSRRVAKYSVEIAKLAGIGEDERKEIYFAALLHDVGKIGIPDSIINKEGKLTFEEFSVIKGHPVIGKQILSSISQSPYLSIGANYHHERYDGRGYPEGLKGDDIPYIARIIAVADAYDAMTSKRSYREPIPQNLVREELVKGMGTQFDPLFAKLMIRLIDVDLEYKLRERIAAEDFVSKDTFLLDEYRSDYSNGVHVTDTITYLHFHSKVDGDVLKPDYIPSILIFDSLDGRVHADDGRGEGLVYYEYGIVRVDGNEHLDGVRKVKRNVIVKKKLNDKERLSVLELGVEYGIEAVRQKDHMILRIDNIYQTLEYIIALPDSTRFAYLAITGEKCVISDVDIKCSEEPVIDNYIPRIAEEISYIRENEGDIPNIQVDGWRSDISEGVLVRDGMEVSFHAMSLPTARLVWHCPFVVLYYSDDGTPQGDNYREFSLIRLDGESWTDDSLVKNNLMFNRNEEFVNWDDWKTKNKEGQDVLVSLEIDGNRIITNTWLCGIHIRNTTLVEDGFGEVYMALSGDQTAITNIRIKIH